MTGMTLMLGRTIRPLIVLPALCYLGSGREQASGQPSHDTTADVISLLASKDYRQRERATKLLIERKEAALLLKKAAKSSDLEVQMRAAAILKERARRHELQMLERLKALVSDGAVDQVAELLAQWPAGCQERPCWI